MRLFAYSLLLGLLSGLGLQAGMTRLEIRPSHAAYSRSTESIVMVSAGPSRLSLWSTATRSMAGSIDLPAVATALTLSQNGRIAAVGHDGRISIVELDPLRIVKVLPVSCEVISLVYFNGWVHAFPKRDQWESIRSVDVETGREELGNKSMYAGTVGKLLPGTPYVYSAQTGLSPDHMEKYNAERGPIQYLYDWTYHGDYSACGDLWPAPDAARILTRCGNLFRASEVRGDDMRYNGRLPVLTHIIDASFALSRNLILAIGTQGTYWYDRTQKGQDQLHLFGYKNLNYLSGPKFPAFVSLGRRFAANGRFVFANSVEDTWYAVVQADPESGLLDDYAIAWGGMAGFALHSATRSGSDLASGQIAVAITALEGVSSAQATQNPAPLRLGGVEVKLVGSDGVERQGRVLSVDVSQVKFVVPEDLPVGPAQLFEDNFNTGGRAIMEATIVRMAPGIFTAADTGEGPPLGIARREPVGGEPILSYLYRRDAQTGNIIPNPIVILGQPCNATPDKVSLSVMGTGFRGATKISATIGGVSVPVKVTPDPDVDGQDRVDIGPLPSGLWSGQVDLVLTADAAASNATKIEISFRNF